MDDATRVVNAAPIDLTLLERRTLGHQVLLRDLLRLFHDHTPPSLERVRDALARGDLAAGRAGVHQLKSSAATIAAGHLADLLAEAEAALLAGDETVLQRLPLIEAETQRCLEQITRLRLDA
ncbi:MAG TPA: Hpt domain-containing protein [Tepidisphaeraceae bacterium]